MAQGRICRLGRRLECECLEGRFLLSAGPLAVPSLGAVVAQVQKSQPASLDVLILGQDQGSSPSGNGASQSSGSHGNGHGLALGHDKNGGTNLPPGQAKKQDALFSQGDFVASSMQTASEQNGSGSAYLQSTPGQTVKTPTQGQAGSGATANPVSEEGSSPRLLGEGPGAREEGSAGGGTSSSPSTVSISGDGSGVAGSPASNGPPVIMTPESAGNPFAAYTVEPMQESAAAMSPAPRKSGADDAPAPAESSVPDSAVLPFLPLEGTGTAGPAERSQTLSLQPLTPTTVAVVPTLVTGGETEANVFASHGEDSAPPNGHGLVRDPAAPAPLAGSVTPAEGGRDHSPRMNAETLLSEQRPTGEAAVQRFVSGVDEAAAPGIGHDGSSIEQPAQELLPAMKTDPPAETTPVLLGPVVRLQADEPAQRPETPTAEPKRVTWSLSKEAERLPAEGQQDHSVQGEESLWSRLVLAVAILGVTWEQKRAIQREDDREESRGPFGRK